ncbi:MAG: cytochrome P450, partial [Acidimicrobiales bacterium]
VVEEIVRFDAPVQGILRLTNSEVEIDGTTIPPDAIVMILFGSANRDKQRWPNADTFDVGREPLDHLGFGSGIHLCLGAHLARLEAIATLEVIRTRTASLQPRGPGVRTKSGLLRGFTSLPVDVAVR